MIDDTTATQAQPELDDAPAAEDTPTAYTDRIARKEAARLATRPHIDDLVDAVVRDHLDRLVLLARPGEKLIVERFATILPGSPWLDTKTYTVQSVDEATGRVHLWDDELQRTALTDYIGGLKAGYRFKLPAKGRPVVASKRKRGRPRKAAPTPTAAQPPVPSADAQPSEKRGRGRPKGVKNRPKAEIAAEKKAKATAKAAKKAVRAAKAAARRPKAAPTSSSKAKPAAAPASRKGPGAAPARRTSAKR